MHKASNRLLLLLLTLMVSSCGYFSDEPVEDSSIYTSNKIATCELDTERLSRINQERVQDEIRCLESGLLDFERGMPSENNSQVEKEKLKRFVSKWYDFNPRIFNNGVELLYSLSHLILKERTEIISEEGIGKATEFLIAYNHFVSGINGINQEMVKRPLQLEDLNAFREEFIQVGEEFTEAIKRQMPEDNDRVTSIDVYETLIYLSNVLKDPIAFGDEVQQLFWIKAGLIGGEKDKLTSQEFKQLLDKLPLVLGICFDMIYYKAEHFPNRERGQADHYNKILEDVINYFSDRDDSERLFSLEEMTNLIGLIGKKYEDSEQALLIEEMENFIKFIFFTKEHLLDSDPEFLTVGDLEELQGYIELGVEAYGIYKYGKSPDNPVNKFFKKISSYINEYIERD